MSKRLSEFHNIDVDDHLFNNLYPNLNVENYSLYYSIENFNKLEIADTFNISLFNCNVRSFAAIGTTFSESLGG